METWMIVVLFALAIAMVALSAHEAIRLRRELKEYKDLINNK
jgi:hypothetical protein